MEELRTIPKHDLQERKGKWLYGLNKNDKKTVFTIDI